MHFNTLSHRHFQKTVLLIIVCFVCAGVFVGVNAADEKIYEINSLKDLTDLRDAVNNGNAYKDYIVKLNVDIDLSGEANWQPIGDDHGVENTHIFKGTFDGQGHTISKLTIHDDEGSSSYAKYWDHGLFGATDGATIKNLVLKNVDAFTEGYITDTISIGSLIGWMKSGSVINCSVSGSVSAEDTVEYVGGLIGRIEGNGKIENCSVSVTDKVHGEGAGDSGVGGLIGWMDDGSVINCSVSGSVSTGEYVVAVGGLIGNIEGCEGSSCSVVNCSFSGSVLGEESVERIGGLIGRLQGNGKVIDCSVNLEGDVKSEGTNTVTSYLGGLIGIITSYSDESSCSVINCCVIGNDHSVVGTDYTNYVGGLIGMLKSNGKVIDCSVNLGNGTVEGGDDAVGGLIGDISSYGDKYSCSVINCSVSGKVLGNSVDSVGGLIGHAVRCNCNVTNCSVSGSVSGEKDVFLFDPMSIGGLIGDIEGNITNCSFSGHVLGVNALKVGGLIGDIKGNITNCSVSGYVSGTDGTLAVGGLIGEMLGDYEGIVKDCSVSLEGDIHSDGTETFNSYLGGLIGVCASNVSNCFVIGNGHSISGSDITDYIGGLIGKLEPGISVSNCFVLLGDGSVAGGGGYVGGLVGWDGGDVSNCFVAGNVIAGKDVECTGGLIGERYSQNIVRNCYTVQNVSCANEETIGGLVGYVSFDDYSKSHVNHCVALNQFIKHTGDADIHRAVGYIYDESVEISQNYGWDEMLVNDHTVQEGSAENGDNVSSEDVWKNLTFWQSVFGSDMISYDGTKTWTIDEYSYESPKSWGLPYLSHLGKPSDKDAEKIQYLNPGHSVVYPTNITYNDGQYAHKQTLSQNKLPRITLYKDVFDITKEEGSNQSFSLDTSAPWENYYLWQNNSQPITFADAITDNVSWNDLESIDAMKNQNITFALGDENQTSISGTERNVSVTVENYLQSYTNNSLDKTRTTDGWFFDTPYTVSLAVRPGPEAYHASEQNGTLWNSHVLIQNLTNNVSKQDSVAWRFATDTQNTTYNTYTVDNQAYLNSTEYLQVKSAESADGENVNITLTGYKLGDVNRNDVVNINDISAMIKLILAAAKDNNTYEAALKAFPNTRIENLIYADDNKKGGDGLIDVGDLLVINDWLVNGSAHFNYDGWE